MNNFYKKYKLIFLGSIIFATYLWLRFLRSRTSKILPFDLNIIKFFTLIYICCIFSYILFSLISSPTKKNIVIEQIMDWLFIPIMELDKFVKDIPFIKSRYQRFISYLIPKLKYPFMKANMFFTAFWIIPRLILITVLAVDVYVFHQLHYKYFFIWVGLLLFFHRYLKHSLKMIKEDMINELTPLVKGINTDYYPGVHPAELAPDYDPNDPDEDDYAETMFLPLKNFIEFQTESIVYRNTRHFMDVLTSRTWDKKTYEKHYKKPYPAEFVPGLYAEFLYDKKELTLVPQIEQLITISVILEFHHKIVNTNKRVINIKILVYLNYLLCWLYVLIISLPNLHTLELLKVLNESWLNITDPFGDENIS